jgi:N-acetylmuramoyl-L-alanine amidase
MAARASIMNPSNVDCIISIHQNSYTQESVDGAQVFYYTDSEDGKNLASLIQNSLIQLADPSNHRQEKPNNSYYLLKNVQNPVVIVECGFLSNWSESKKLVDDTYQQTLAWAIHLGVLQYLNGVTVNLHISK